MLKDEGCKPNKVTEKYEKGGGGLLTRTIIGKQFAVSIIVSMQTLWLLHKL